MSEFEDERVRFFLEHQELIKTWAALEKTASELAHDFLCSCASELEALTDEIGGKVQLYVHTEGQGAKMFLYRPAWAGKKKMPRVAIGLEWPRTKVNLGEGRSPYVGIHVDRQQKGGSALVKFMLTNFAKALGANGFTKGKTSDWWPTYRYLRASDAYWDNLEPYRQAVVSGTREAWDLFADPVDQGLQALAAQ